MNWNDLKLVIAIAEAGTLSGAARAIDSSQPTLSRRLAAFEDELGYRVFERGLGGYRLTAVGKGLYERALRMEFEARQIETDLARARGRMRHIVVSATETFAKYCVTPAMAAFQSGGGGAELSLFTTYDKADMRNREADIAIRIGEPTEVGLKSRLVGRMRFWIYGSQSYLEENGEPLSLDDLAVHAVVGSSDPIGRFMQTRLLMEHCNPRRIRFISDSVENQISAVRAGQGLMAFGAYIAPHEPELRPVLRDAFAPALDVHLVVNEKTDLTPSVRELLDFLEERLGRDLA